MNRRINTALSVQQLSFSYGNRMVLDNLCISFPEGKTTAILGPSGSGKSTLLKLIAGLIQPDTGSITPAPHTLITGYVFQDFCLLPWLTVQDNIALVLRPHNLSPDAITERIQEVLTLTGLLPFADTFPYQLSGGMQQRAGLARAMAVHPSLLLLDEPFSAIDGQTRELLIDEYHRLCKQWPMTRILITHQLDDAFDLADQLLLLSSRPARVLHCMDLPDSISPAQRDKLRSEIWQHLRKEVQASDRHVMRSSIA